MSIDTVNDLPPRVQYVASAAQTTFDYTFPIFADGDLVVDVDGVTKTLTTHYTVAGEGNNTGGTVTFLSSLTGGEIVTIYRDMAIERTTDFSQNGEFSSATFNDELDRITLVLQDLRSQIHRSLRLPMTAEVADTETEFTPISSWLNKVVRIGADGVPEPVTISESTTVGEGYALLSGAAFTGAVSATNSMAVSGAAPGYFWSQTDGATDQKYTRIYADGANWDIRLYNDALSSYSSPVLISRSGTTVSSITLAGSAVNLNADTTIAGRARIESATARLEMYESDAGSNEKHWEFRASGGDFFLYTSTDAGSAAGTPLAITRTGTAVDSIAFNGTAISLTGAVTLNNTLAVTSTSTLTGTVTTGGNIELGHASDTTLSRIAAGRIAVEGVEIGYRSIPQSATTGTLVASDNGKHVPLSAGITVPAGVFSIGDSVLLFNNTAGNLTITQGSSVTLRQAGTASTGNRTLAQRGVASVLCVGSNEFVISGAGLS